MAGRNESIRAVSLEIGRDSGCDVVEFAIDPNEKLLMPSITSCVFTRSIAIFGNATVAPFLDRA